MRVKFLEGAAGTGVVYYRGDEADLPDALARRYIAQGTCVSVVAAVVKPAVKRAVKRETATRDQRELGVAE